LVGSYWDPSQFQMKSSPEHPFPRGYDPMIIPFPKIVQEGIKTDLY